MSQEITGQVNTHHQKRLAPGPQGNFYGGEILAMMKDPIAVLTQLSDRYGGLVRFQKGYQFRYLLVDPSGIQQVLLENQKNYEKSKSYDKLRLVLGNGLVTSQGKEWVEQRKLAQSFFRPQALANYRSIMENECDRMLERWNEFAKTSVNFDLVPQMMKLSLSIVGKSLFGVDLGDQSLSISRATTVAIHETNRMMESPFPWMRSIDIIGKVRFHNALKTLNTSVMQIISERRKTILSGPSDLLGRILKETQLSNENVRDQLVTLLLAGHETTATALSWAFYLILQDPNLIEKIRSEAAENSITGFPASQWTEAAIHEVLRLYPPVWIFSRQAKCADQILGYDIEPGATINISPYLTQHSAAYWDQPQLFKPERFIDKNPSEFLSGSYIPFAMGGRQCLGAGFAIQEMILVIQKILNAFDLKLLHPEKISILPVVVIRPHPGIELSIKPIV